MYINYYSNNALTQNYTFEQLLNNEPLPVAPQSVTIKTINTNQVTRQSKQKLIRDNKINQAISMLDKIINMYGEYIDITNLHEHYTTFKIPKRSGGLRTINAPQGALKATLQHSYDVFKNILRVLPHDAAYAYTKQRDSYEALKKHQASNYFLKLDIKDFFPSCTKELLCDKLKLVFPYTLMFEIDNELMERLINLCLLDNQLPQGTNMSPILTNSTMVQFDAVFTTYCNKNGFVYTRYADDMLISHKESFDFHHTTAVIEHYFKDLNYPFKIKKEKTRYGSVKGANWNLGLMLNKDHNITVGHKNKKIFKAMINNFLSDLTKNTKWDKMDAYELQGIYSYYHRVEPEYVDYLIKHYNEKYNKDFINELKEIIRN